MYRGPERCTTMNEEKWLLTADPATMFRFLLKSREYPTLAQSCATSINCFTPYKIRLFACACARRVWGDLSQSCKDVIAAVESFTEHADLSDERHGLDESLQNLAFAEQFRLWCNDNPGTSSTNITPEWAKSLWALMATIPNPLDYYEINVSLRRSVPIRDQESIVRDLAGNPFRTLVTNTVPMQDVDLVKSLVQGIYDYRLPDGTLDPQRLLVLLDALEDIGYECKDVTNHLRGLKRCHKCAGLGYVLRTEQDLSRIREGYKTKIVSRSCDYSCGGKGWVADSGDHCRGCWAVDLLSRLPRT